MSNDIIRLKLTIISLKTNVNINIYMEFYEKLKAVRKALRFSQADFANKFSIKQSYYSAIERGKNAIPATLLTILFNDIGVSTEWYYNDNGGMFKSDNSVKYSSNSVVNDMLIDLNRDPKFKDAKEVSLKLFSKYHKDFNDMINILTDYWENVSKTMQFIYQFDCYVQNNITLEIYDRAKSNNYKKEDLYIHIENVFSKIKEINPIIQTLADEIGATITNLNEFDIEKTLDRNDYKDALKAASYHDYDKMVKYEMILSLLKKEYPNL